jgi:hypothetical protein
MRVEVLMSWSGVTKEKYEEIRKAVNWEHDTPKGAVLHLAAFNKDGCQVNDIWESEADFNNFVKNRLYPQTTKAGIKTQPKVEIIPVHEIFAPGLRSGN